MVILVPSKVCLLLRMKRQNLQLLGKSVHYTETNFLDRQVTSAIELSTEQCEVKPQIGSLVGKESGHALHSSTKDVSIRN